MKPVWQGGSSGKRAVWGKRLRWFGTLLSLALLAWLLARQDWNRLIESAAGLSLWRLLLAYLALMIAQIWRAFRWGLLLRAQAIGVPLGRLIKVVFVGLFASNFLPSTIGGDVARVAAILPADERRVAGAASVVVDRALSVFSMLVLLPFCWPLLVDFFASGNAALASGVMAGDSRWVTRLRNGLGELRLALSLWASQPASLLVALIFSWLGLIFHLSSMWTVARGLGIDVNLAQVAGATGVTYFLTLIPFSINGYGLRELGVVTVYSALGATPEAATAQAFVTRGVMLAVTLIGALWLGEVSAPPDPIASRIGSQDVLDP